MLRIAHRGLNHLALQNTIPAFELAVQHGMDGVELDVQRAKCGTPMVFHDDTLDDLFGVSGTIADFTAQDLIRLRSPLAGRFPDIDPDRMHIPRLRDVLTALPARRTFTINVEIKAASVQKNSATDGVALVMGEFRDSSLLVSSFNPLELVRFTRRMPEVPLGLLFGPATPYALNTGWPKRILKKIRLDALHPQFEIVDRKLVADAKQEGLQVNVWTVNDPSWAAWLKGLGVSAVISDDPREF